MFRALSRKNQQLSREECIRLLDEQRRGVLSVLGEDGYPYGMPMNHWYDRRDGSLYFHCGRSGHRLDALRQNNKVSFCTHDHGVRAEGEWAWTVRSVIVFGRVELVDDWETVVDVTTQLSRNFIQDEEHIRKEIAAYGQETLLLRLIPEHICGKRVKES